MSERSVITVFFTVTRSICQLLCDVFVSTQCPPVRLLVNENYLLAEIGKGEGFSPKA